MGFDKVVVKGLGAARAHRTEERVKALTDRAAAAPQYSVAAVHLPVPRSATTSDAADLELGQLLHRTGPDESWNYVTLLDTDGKHFGKASPYLRQTAPLGSLDWLVTFTFSDLYTRLGAWWLAQLWCGAELAAGARDALGQWNVLIAAACARSLLEGAAHLATETPKLIESWDEFKRSGRPTHESLKKFSDTLNQRVTHLQYASRVGQGQGQTPKAPSANVMTYLNKLAKHTRDFDVIDIYEWLCDAVHPSFGSLSSFGVVRAVDPARSHVIEHYARDPLDLIVSNPRTQQPTVAHKAADAIILAVDTIDRHLTNAQWVMDDLGLTTEIGDALLLNFPLRHLHPDRNAPCPCGSGRRLKRCMHRWG
ncbi:YecA family protein [Streptomyces sp. bgisy031]|uniref:YecA family protein n=1 Tax=Streptomyces sp. bgisy031 TaxID=3413772 RepID=UPI003D724F31